MLERVVISRRTSEQELDLLMLLEEDAPEAERARPILKPSKAWDYHGEAWPGEIATAVSEWLATIKDKMEGHDRFQLAVARNALGIIARQECDGSDTTDLELAKLVFSDGLSLETPEVLALLRDDVLGKVGVDSPKYPALEAARKKWR